MITEDILPSLALYALFAAISMMIYKTMGAKCQSKIIVFGRRMIMMVQPTTVWTCVTLVASFAGHVNASIYYENGLCLKSAYNKIGGLTCGAGDVQKGFVSRYSGQTECNAGENFSSRTKPQTLKIPTTLTLQETCAGEDASLGNKDEGYFLFAEAVSYNQHDLICFHL